VAPGARQAEQWALFAATGRDEPGITPADRVTPELLGQVAYNKPATGLYLLRHAILDSTRFDTAFREYIRRWAFKHPTPADFFRSMEDGVGEDLSYFWRGWFLRTDVVIRQWIRCELPRTPPAQRTPRSTSPVRAGCRCRWRCG